MASLGTHILAGSTTILSKPPNSSRSQVRKSSVHSLKCRNMLSRWIYQWNCVHPKISIIGFSVIFFNLSDYSLFFFFPGILGNVRIEAPTAVSQPLILRICLFSSCKDSLATIFHQIITPFWIQCQNEDPRVSPDHLFAAMRIGLWRQQLNWSCIVAEQMNHNTETALWSSDAHGRAWLQTI